MAYQFHRFRVLIVEDMSPMLRLKRAILKNFGFEEIDEVMNGADGFEMFQKRMPDIVLTDWLMKPVDGIELTKRIRGEPKSVRPDVPIIMITGYSYKTRVEQARDAGVTEFLVKPFTAQDMYKRITQVIEKPRLFVDSGDFYGPDRRRQSNKSYYGPLRRYDDPLNTTSPQHNWDDELLLELRDRTGTGY